MPSSAPFSSTPSLRATIRAEVEKRLGTLNKAIPGVISTYDPASQTATVRPQVRPFVLDTDTREPTYYDPPVIEAVPVIFPGTGRGGLAFNLTNGDPVWLMFADRSMDEYVLNAQSLHDPTTLRLHDTMDCVAYPTTPILTLNQEGWKTAPPLKLSGDVQANLYADEVAMVSGGTGVFLDGGAASTLSYQKVVVADKLQTAMASFVTTLNVALSALAVASGAVIVLPTNTVTGAAVSAKDVYASAT